jgi:outer membrane protein TolC
MEIRDPSQMPKARLPRLPSPPTVAAPQPGLPPENLSLDEAIRTALAYSEVVRVLAGAVATSSGSTIYDPAITNTQIDQARGRFDPSAAVRNNFSRQESPGTTLDPSDPNGQQVIIVGAATNNYAMATGVSKTTITGGSLNLDVNAAATRSNATVLKPDELNPNTTSSLDLSFTQPLFQGGGRRSNLAPIVLARIDTERSFFQLKGSVEQLVQGVIEAYWAVVFARINVWVLQQQVRQGEQALLIARKRLQVGQTDSAEVEQARSALANFEASRIGAEADLLAREAALRNILGLPPSDDYRIVPVTPLNAERLEIRWEELIRLAEDYRPDLIELKLILEADEQRLLVARNNALPRVDATALYRWNGLEGRTPGGMIVSSGPGEFTGWELGVNFSVPLGLRQARAGLRQQELIIMRDRADLQQGLHSTLHLLALSYRNVAQHYQQYQAYQAASQASRINLILQRANYEANRTIYLNVLQAITAWGSARSAEAQALAQYNTELANLELQTGTILESHGIRFFEERYGSIGPLGRLFRERCYPRDERPGPNASRYPETSEPAEEAFGLQPPTLRPGESSGGDRSGPLPPGGEASPRQPSPYPERLRIEIPERIPPPPAGRRPAD